MEISSLRLGYELTEKEYVRAYSEYRKSKRRVFGPGSDLAVSILLLCLGLTNLHLRETTLGILCLVLAPILPTVNYAVIPGALGREFRKNPRLRSRAIVEFSEQGVSANSELGAMSTRWEAIARCVQTPELVLVVAEPRMFYIIPKRTMTAEQLSVLQALMTRKIPAVSRP
jgi:hypothetical protein